MASNATVEREILRNSARMLDAICETGNADPSRAFDPVWRAAFEIRTKLSSSRFAELHHSSKLYRAIDDIENTALVMPKYKHWRKSLAVVSAELRRITGWREGE